ncbi:MAG: hypothetical protein LBR70_03915 [Lactobacillaceae bacterium]|jgi:hypothetical protein|nr:hypothetical protein [Lactobacillaceae bacterium]
MRKLFKKEGKLYEFISYVRKNAPKWKDKFCEWTKETYTGEDKWPGILITCVISAIIILISSIAISDYRQDVRDNHLIYYKNADGKICSTTGFEFYVEKNIGYLMLLEDEFTMTDGLKRRFEQKINVIIYGDHALQNESVDPRVFPVKVEKDKVWLNGKRFEAHRWDVHDMVDNIRNACGHYQIVKEKKLKSLKLKEKE